MSNLGHAVQLTRITQCLFAGRCECGVRMTSTLAHGVPAHMHTDTC